MSVFTMADLHLSTASGHEMDVFGSRWRDYTKKIVKNWRAVIKDGDTVILPGDISWAMNLDEAREDFALLDSLPGKKLLGKGNHDFWWDTATKCNKFFDEHKFSTLTLLYNNAFIAEDFIVCGTRGWFLEKTQQITVGEVDFEKISNRENMRLRMSLDAARSLQQSGHGEKEILCFLHFPLVWGDFVAKEMLQTLQAYGVRRCYYGHIHGNYHAPRTQSYENLTLSLISSDFLDFVPHKILPL
ncbi:MAG: serine/threonine protein phosphatase [Ruminococcaceae bacterium]|nr:serine/threonine protein phosphatase [Oscillospiraceae bacterium]